MKTKLALADYSGGLDERIMRRVERAVRLVPLEVPDKKRAGLIRADWRDLLPRFLQRVFPHAWIYRGGHHIAIHASPPRPSHNPKLHQPEAGACLFRVIETNR